jgi:ABC-2 type transport system permease protein
VSITRSLVIFRQNLRLLLGDPGPIFIFILTPLLVMAVIKPTQQVVLRGQGYIHANGAEQVVPGFITMFAFFWVAFVGRNFVAEHGWGTWERLQVSPATPGDIMLGKVLPAFLVILAQMGILFGLGYLLFGLTSKGPAWSLILVAVPLATCVLALTLALVGLVRTLTQVDAFGNLITMLFASLGGALAAIAVLPGWARDIAPATPGYWANKAAANVILNGKDVGAVLGPAAVLVAFTVGFAVVAATTFNFSEAKSIEV